MPIFNPNSTVVPTPVPNPIAPIVETASVYQNTNERVKITPHIEGNTWTVEYYGRVIGDMDPATLDTDIDEETLIQFQLIKNMELRVTQELQQYTDPQTQTSTLQGTANMYPIVIPIIGDVFLAQLGDGTWGKFAITSTERLSMFKTSAWTITYTLSEYVTQIVLDDVNGKVVETLVFDLKGLNESGGALATLSEYERTVLRKKYIIDMIDMYYEEFFKPTIKTFIYTGEYGYTYDPYIVDFWNYFIGKEKHSDRDIPHQFDIRGAIFKNEYVTLFDALQRQSRSVLQRVVYSMREIATTALQLPYIHFTLHSSGIGFVVHPYAVDGLALTDHTDINSVPLVPYIFTEAFYNNLTIGQTPLELQVQKMIDQIIIPFSDIEPIYQSLSTLTHKERFYYIPILIALFSVSR